MKVCSICGKEFKGFGNNPWPVRIDSDATCCNECNAKYVIAARVATMCTPHERIVAVANQLNTKTPNELDLVFDLLDD